jgi:hypothetical protein
MATKATDPPGAERKCSDFCKRVRGLFRKLVNRRTLLIAFQVVFWVYRIVRMIGRLLGDL